MKAPPKDIFTDFAKELRFVCVACQNSLRTYEHPIHRGSHFCGQCIKHEDYAVVRKNQAQEQYRFPPNDLPLYCIWCTPWSGNPSFNKFAHKRQVDKWYMKKDVRMLAIELYGTDIPLPPERVRERNRQMGILKRVLNSKVRQKICMDLEKLGFHAAEIHRLQNMKIWKRVPKCFGNVSPGLPVKLSSPVDDFVTECRKIIDDLRNDFDKFHAYEAAIHVHLTRMCPDLGVICDIMTSVDCVRHNPYCWHYGVDRRFKPVPEIHDVAFVLSNISPTHLEHYDPARSYRKKPLDWRKLAQ